MKKFLIPTLLAVLTSCYIFPFEVTFLPAGVNVKMLMAGFGLAAFVYKCISEKTILLTRTTIGSALFAAAFSIWCLICITLNGTSDRTYVDYWISFGTWLTGAYGVYILLHSWYDKVDLFIITKYLAYVGIGQCVIALLIDNIPAVNSAVNSIIVISQEFYERAGRLYGIGCALDVAGVRFSAFQVLIAHQIVRSQSGNEHKKSILFFLIAFIVITIIGSMISRTTIVGTALGLFYMLISYFSIKRGGYIEKRQIRYYSILIGLFSIAILTSIYLYNTSPIFHENLRFGFENFFNWAETGEFRSGSTDILQTMWIWPEDTRTWWIGTGLYGVFVWGTDIGYCLFTLYCGIPGLIIFSVFFIYNHLSLNRKFKNFFFLSLLLIAITFIVWSKVATDIFFIDALLFCIDGDKGIEEPESEEELATEITA